MTNFNVRLRKVQDIYIIMYNTSRKILLRCDILIKITTSVHASLKGKPKLKFAYVTIIQTLTHIMKHF